ncbi:extracellular solute-binding protein family 3 [Stackebrandtia nassauensis DSM 44728]|uniref:Extracellular solute-binding protein family 3 n=2 Tax=Stackebrandtia TaxID=283810 RepID=D3Q6K1_STANL|nr:extracellular solute-binding protein family 3 [Stackebrandtia nassauensis DSM 44728]
MTAQPRWSRRDLFRGGLLAGGLALAPGLLTGCSLVGGDSIKKIEAGDPITLGMSNEPPFAYKDDNGKVIGESVAIYTHILKKLGAEDGQIETKIVDWNSLIPGLRADDYDLISAGMFINKLRCERAIFSEPDYICKTALLVKKGNPHNLKDFGSFKKGDNRVGLVTAGAELALAEAAGVPKKNMKQLPNNNDLKSALHADQIAAIALTSPAMNYMADTSNGAFETVKPPFGPKDENGEEQIAGAGGAVFRDDDTNFRDAVNEELAKIKTSVDSWLKITGEFGFTKYEYPDPKNPKYTTAELCKV